MRADFPNKEEALRKVEALRQRVVAGELKVPANEAQLTSYRAPGDRLPEHHQDSRALALDQVSLTICGRARCWRCSAKTAPAKATLMNVLDGAVPARRGDGRGHGHARHACLAAGTRSSPRDRDDPSALHPGAQSVAEKVVLGMERKLPLQPRHERTIADLATLGLPIDHAAKVWPCRLANSSSVEILKASTAAPKYSSSTSPPLC